MHMITTIDRINILNKDLPKIKNNEKKIIKTSWEY